METLFVGKIVHFVMPDGTHRPAIVVNVYDGNNADLQVFDAENGILWQPSAYRFDTPTPYTWHWIEPVQ